MSDEARQGAWAQYRKDYQPNPSHLHREAIAYRAGWEDNNAWQASRNSDSIAEIKDRLTASGYSDTDRVRIALLHIEAIDAGRAQPPRKVEVTDEMIEAFTDEAWKHEQWEYVGDIMLCTGCGKHLDHDPSNPIWALERHQAQVILTAALTPPVTESEDS